MLKNVPNKWTHKALNLGLYDFDHTIQCICEHDHELLLSSEHLPCSCVHDHEM